MKIHKIFTLDEEIVKKLDGINASYLINTLLIEHFKGNNDENLNLLKKKFIENKQLLKENKRKDKELRQKIAKIEQKEKEIINITRKLTKEEQQNNLNLWELAHEKSKTKKVSEIKQIYLEMKGGKV